MTNPPPTPRGLPAGHSIGRSGPSIGAAGRAADASHASSPIPNHSPDNSIPPPAQQRPTASPRREGAGREGLRGRGPRRTQQPSRGVDARGKVAVSQAAPRKECKPEILQCHIVFSNENRPARQSRPGAAWVAKCHAHPSIHRAIGYRHCCRILGLRQTCKTAGDGACIHANFHEYMFAVHFWM